MPNLLRKFRVYIASPLGYQFLLAVADQPFQLLSSLFLGHLNRLSLMPLNGRGSFPLKITVHFDPKLQAHLLAKHPSHSAYMEVNPSTPHILYCSRDIDSYDNPLITLDQVNPATSMTELHRMIAKWWGCPNDAFTLLHPYSMETAAHGLISLQDVFPALRAGPGMIPNSSDNLELLADFSVTEVFKIETLNTANVRIYIYIYIYI